MKFLLCIMVLHCSVIWIFKSAQVLGGDDGIGKILGSHLLNCDPENPDLGCICTKEYEPLCGSDGITYNNWCYFNCTRECNPALVCLHNGRCDESTPVRDPPCHHFSSKA